MISQTPCETKSDVRSTKRLNAMQMQLVYQAVVCRSNRNESNCSERERDVLLTNGSEGRRGTLADFSLVHLQTPAESRFAVVTNTNNHRVKVPGGSEPTRN